MFCRGCVFAPLSHKILNMARPKLSPRDIWRTLILACRRTLSPLAVWKIPMPKITLFFTGNPLVVTAIFIGVLDFWMVLVLQFSDNTYRLSLENGYRSIRAIPMDQWKSFWHAQQLIQDVGRQEAEINKTTSEFLLLSLGKRNAKTLRPRKPMHVY